jgi:hypothetical protein
MPPSNAPSLSALRQNHPDDLNSQPDDAIAGQGVGTTVS